MSKLESWENIEVTLVIAGGGSPVTRASDKMKYEFHTQECDPKHVRPFAYFKFNEVDPNRNLKVEVKYTRSAWTASARAADGDIPEIYFRTYDGGWGEEWEFIDNVKVIQEPTDANPYGILTAELPFIPDPAIGGC